MKQNMQTNTQLPNHVNKPKVSIFVNETDLRLFLLESEIGLDSKIKEIEGLMKTKNGFGAADEIKDELYGESKKFWKEYAEKFQQMKFSFYLNRPEFNWLTNLISKNLEYDVNNVFYVIELKRSFDEWENTITGSRFENDKDMKEFGITAIDMEYLWALVSPYKMKGLSKDTYIFAKVLQRMIELRQISMYYDSEGKRLGKEIQEWVASFESDPSKANKNAESVEGVSIAATA